MNEYTLSFTDEQVRYFENLDCQSLLDDMENIVNLIDSLNIDDEDLVEFDNY